MKKVEINFPYVHFQDVGPSKLHWGVRIERPVTEAKIVAAIKKRKALGSKGIEVDFGDSDYSGTIYVGIGRRVGRVLIVPMSAGRPEPEILEELRSAGVTYQQAAS